MDLTEKRRLDAARQQVDAAHQQVNEAARQQVKKVRKRARPWRSIIALVLALLMAAVSRSARADAASAVFTGTPYRALGRTGTEIAADAAALAFCLLASAATAGLAGKARDVLRPKVGTAHAAVVRYAVVLFGGLATFLITLELFGIGVTQLLVGGAFATVLVGIAAQQSMANLFAGMVLLLARPVDVGDWVLVRSGSLGGDFRGNVTEIGITYVRLDTADGPVHLPNSQLLAAAIAPLNSNPQLNGKQLNGNPPASDRPPDGSARLEASAMQPLAADVGHGPPVARQLVGRSERKEMSCSSHGLTHSSRGGSSRSS